MKDVKPDIYELKDKELQLQTLVAGSDKQDLAQCVRLISMYVSIYKQQFGELPPDSYQHLVGPEEISESSARIFAGGLNEAINMLDTVIRANTHKKDVQAGRISIN